MPTPTLPVEIHAHIIRHTDRHDLLNLLLISRSFNREAERRFYRDITFKSSRQAELRFESFSNHLSQTDHLATYIHTLNIKFLINVSYGRLEDICNRLRGLYSHILNLKVLILTLCEPFNILPQPSSPFRLRVLHVSTLGSNEHLGETTVMKNLLEVQSHLVEFRTTKQKFFPLSPTSLPHLRILHCPPQHLVTLLPGRSVTHLRIVRGHEGSKQCGSRTERLPTGSLRCIRITEPHLLLLFMEVFSALGYLELTLDVSDESKDTADQAKELYFKLRAMPILRILRIVARSSKPSAELIASLFSLFPRLGFVDIYDGTDQWEAPDGADEAERWIRGREMHESVRWEDSEGESMIC